VDFIPLLLHPGWFWSHPASCPVGIRDPFQE